MQRSTTSRAEQIAMDTGFSSLLYRVHLTGARRARARVIVKLPAESEARGAMEMLGGYRREVAFYRTSPVARRCGTPQVYAAQMARGLGDFVLVLEDLARLGQRRPPGRPLDGPGPARASPNSPGCTPGRSSRRIALRCRPSRASTRRSPATCCLPAFASGWQVYREHCRRDGPAGGRRRSPSASPSGRAAALQALTERDDAAARRHPRRQRVLRRRPAARSSTSSSPPAASARPTSATWSVRACRVDVRPRPRRAAGPGVPRTPCGPRRHRLLVRRGMAALPVRRRPT